MSDHRSLSPRMLIILAVLLVVASLPAQGQFVNFETAPVDPMALVRIEDHDYLLVCNTPDNSVEIYDTVDMSMIQRVPVGLRPVTVRWNPLLARFYTANFVGDSVTQVEFRPRSPGQIPLASVERTTHVGDEPTDIAFLPDLTSFFVTLQSRSALAWFDAFLHFPTLAGFSERIDLTMPMLHPAATRAIKEPRRVLFAGPVLLILGHKGGNTPNSYDFDCLVINVATGYVGSLGDLGSTNFNFEVGADGRLYTVGLFARNNLQGEVAVSQAPTGFVQSGLYVVSGFGGPQATVDFRDLHRDDQDAIVPRQRAVAYPTDVALLESGTDVTKVFVTGFSSDRIAVLHNPLDGSTIETWSASHIDVANARPGYGRTGPRSMILKEPAGVAGDPGRRLYVLNWLNHSITVIDPAAETVLQNVPLDHDPTPGVIRVGREFLYSADRSGNGFVSCAVCHIDGRTDFLTWNLGDLAGGNGRAIPQELLDGTTGSFFNKDKGPLVTQTLQGLLQHPVDGSSQPNFARTLLDNVPFHWRGDIFDLVEFNGAFVNLMGMPNLGTPQTPRGITESDMDAFVAMLETIVFPPNPEQALDRLPTGSFGDPQDESAGSGAARGMKLYYSRPVLAGRSCVHCHATPHGTNRRIVQTVGNPTFFSAQPLKTPQIRGLFQRESLLESPFLQPSTTVTGEFGLLRRGAARTSVDRLLLGFEEGLPGQDLTDVIAFVRQIDWGVPPIVGRAVTADALNVSHPVLIASVTTMEQQVERGDTGLAANSRSGAVTRSWYYDVTVDPPGYREFGTATVLSRAGLLALVGSSRDRVIFQATEPGSERRVAAPDGRPPAGTTGPAPANITLEPMKPAVHWLQAHQVTKNWNKGTGPNDFNFTAVEPVTGRPLPDPIFLRAQRIYQHALIQDAPSLGVTRPGHDAPRRFRIAGDDLRLGARLRLHVPVEAPPPVNSDPQTEIIELPLFPTTEQTVDGRRIWVSSAELPQFFTLTLLCGGPFAPGVDDTRRGLVLEPPPAGIFDILGWNQYRVDVVNEDGTNGSGSWQTLTVE